MSPSLSVCIVTYNQEDYIFKTIESMLNQKVNFDYEIIVGDDCSTDNTRKIVQSFVGKYPFIIKPIFHEKNVGPIENIKSVYKKARGKYICHLDGDDYALPNKLQKQFDILEKNSDCSICSHSMQFVDEHGKYVKTWSHLEGKYSLNDLYENLPFFAHSSKMFRNDFKLNYLDELHPQALDIEIHIAQAKQGNIYHIDEELGAYRVNVGMSYINKKVNPIVPLGVMRAYEQIFAEEKDASKVKAYKKKYSTVMLYYARECLKTNSDYDLYLLLVRKSLSLGIYNTKQILHYLISLFPKGLYKSLNRLYLNSM
ncbi:glycosyltransferase family 2 protein [Acinetobacter faecalis]|uniref:glycosyltransferase family 2 protein n=1 Tax=Acinetobacter faecalis TaxID=2665161 RepID=UPI002A911D53|nr:glycosyltransferase family 2 protein [Acinetobacter faecalis]MDY6488852.1 glycosyltransferase family 2 protein [Acinetobacter faecalis]